MGDCSDVGERAVIEMDGRDGPMDSKDGPIHRIRKFDKKANERNSE